MWLASSWLALLSLPLLGVAQSQSHQIWYELDVAIPVREKWRIEADATVRPTYQGTTGTVFTVRGAARYYIIPQLSVLVGAANFYSDQPGAVWQNEYRPWGGLRLEQRLGKRWQLVQYFRYELQDFHYPEAEPWTRSRFRCQISGWYDVSKRWTVRASIEPFVFRLARESDYAINQLRWEARVFYALNSRIRLRASYQLQRTELAAGHRLDHQIRLGVGVMIVKKSPD